MRGETKEQRFKRVGEKRVQNVLDSIRKLSQCANKRIYESNEGQLEKIFGAIDQEIKKCRERFEANESEQFTL